MIALTTLPFDAGAALSAFSLGRTQTGAVASFLGLARGEAGAVTALELEAYPEFTEREIGARLEAARARFDLQDAGVIHRIGVIAPGEAIVLVMTASMHRRAAFEACDYLMDYLKSQAPFWKRQHGPDGATWIEPYRARSRRSRPLGAPQPSHPHPLIGA